MTHDPDRYLPFGMSQNQNKTIGELPDSYLRWLLETNWFEKEYPNYVKDCDEELIWRTKWNTHIN